jgi:hypothetical protein
MSRVREAVEVASVEELVVLAVGAGLLGVIGAGGANKFIHCSERIVQPECLLTGNGRLSL